MYINKIFNFEFIVLLHTKIDLINIIIMFDVHFYTIEIIYHLINLLCCEIYNNTPYSTN